MDARVVRIEEWAKLADARMGRIEDKLDRLSERLSVLPTSAELFGYTATAAALAFAVVAIVAAVFAYRQDTLIALSDRAIQAGQPSQPPPQPIVIHITPPAPPAPAP